MAEDHSKFYPRRAAELTLGLALGVGLFFAWSHPPREKGKESARAADSPSALETAASTKPPKPADPAETTAAPTPGPVTASDPQEAPVAQPPAGAPTIAPRSVAPAPRHADTPAPPKPPQPKGLILDD